MTGEETEDKLDITMDQADDACNCNDEYKTTLCPIHQKDIELDKGLAPIKEVVVTDESLLPEKIRSFYGLTFYCPNCKEASILDIFKHCPECGVKIKLQSKTLTEVINKSASTEKPALDKSAPKT